MHSSVFTYGSLMFPPVWRHVVAGNYRSQPATAHGYARFAVSGETYPGMVAQSGAAVEGVLYLGLRPEAIALLDRFEGDAYRRVSIDVMLAGGTTAPAVTYLYIAEDLSARPWDPAAFELERFMQSWCGGRNAY
jgi:gamma-glutamylcyclotransferase (GGCT)/AIG2-like uncharacterized protein YtfP